MRYAKSSQHTVIKNNKCRRWGIGLLAAALLVLGGCNQDQIDSLQAQLDRLQQVADKQSQALTEAQTSLQALQDQQTALDEVEFRVADIQYDLMEKAFEPLLVGSAKLDVSGSRVPDLIFVEWSLFISPKGEGEVIGPISFIQRVEKGKAKLHFTQPLPSHNIKKHPSLIKIVPTGWYLGHVAKIKS